MVEAFLQAFRRFLRWKGLPAKMFSDNKKTYKSAAKEVRKSLRIPRLFEALALQGVKWHLMTERSPWEGGENGKKCQMMDCKGSRPCNVRRLQDWLES